MGVAGALQFKISRRFAISPRLEYFDDAGGVTTGTVQKLHEITVTGEYNMAAGLVSRLEYRRDMSTVPYFYRGGVPSSSRSQGTVTLGLIGYFPCKR
jgi:hypothetical protein